LIKGPNIQSLPLFEALPNARSSDFIKNGDDISTDGILKAGAEVLPLRSNIQK
jgi:aconitate hydratase